MASDYEYEEEVCRAARFEEENAELKAENERLNKEADWLAETLEIQLRDSCGCVWCWLSEFDMCNGNCLESLRKAAREAVEGEENV